MSLLSIKQSIFVTIGVALLWILVLLLAQEEDSTTQQLYYTIQQPQRDTITTQKEEELKKRRGSWIPYTKCGEGDKDGWQEKYIALHKKILSGVGGPDDFSYLDPPTSSPSLYTTMPSSQKYVISVAIEMGLADRMTGLISLFWYAVLTGRAFQMLTFDSIPGFDAVMDYPRINMSNPGYPRKFFSIFTMFYLGPRVYSADVDTGANWPYFLVNRHPDNMYTKNLSEFPEGHTNARNIFMASNRDMGLELHTAFPCAFEFLFRPNENLTAMLEPRLKILKDSTTLKIAINIRVGDFNMGEEVPLEQVQYYFKCAEEIEKTRALPGQKVMWILTSDNLSIRQQAKEKWGDKIFTDTNTTIQHTNCGIFGSCDNETLLEQWRLSFADMITFGWGDYHVYYHESGFGRLGALLNTKPNHIYALPTKKLEDVKCGPNDYTPIREVMSVAASV